MTDANPTRQRGFGKPPPTGEHAMIQWKGDRRDETCHRIFGPTGQRRPAKIETPGCRPAAALHGTTIHAGLIGLKGRRNPAKGEALGPESLKPECGTGGRVLEPKERPRSENQRETSPCQARSR